MTYLNPLNWLRWIGIAATALLAGLAIGSRNRGKIERGKDAEKYRNTRKRTDQADIGRGDPDDDTDWLRNRAKRRDL